MTEPSGPDPTNSGTPISAHHTSLEDESGEHFAVPLGSLRSGRLRFTNGAHRVVIRADSRLRGLYRASFGERMPIVGVRGELPLLVAGIRPKEARPRATAGLEMVGVPDDQDARRPDRRRRAER
jgi:hypothetical protein